MGLPRHRQRPAPLRSAPVRQRLADGAADGHDEATAAGHTVGYDGPTMSADDTPGPDGSFFSAFRPGPRPRRAWLLPIVSAVVALVAVTVPLYFLIRPTPGSYQVATPRGLRTLSPGMSESQVGAVLGVPFLSEKKGSALCFRYGTPTLDVPWFLVHTVCFEDGKMRGVSSERFAVERVEPASP